MRKKWFTLGCLTSFIILLLFLFLLGRAIGKFVMKGNRTKPILPSSVLYIKLNGNIPEYSILKDDFFGKKILTVHSLISKIKAAKKDKDISMIIIEPQFITTGYANLYDIIKALKDFKESGKIVLAYLETASTKDYFLSSIANKIYLNPSASAGILLKGIGINAHFYKNLLEHLGIKINVIHAGKYKGYGENYSRTNFSEPVRENLDLLLDGIYNNLIEDISKNRKQNMNQIKKVFENRDRLFINQQEALKLNLVDELKNKEKMLDEYNIDDKHIVTINNYNRKINYLNKSQKIAVVYLEGPIISSLSKQSPYKMTITSKKYNKLFRTLKNDMSIKAVVLRINSPGGSALESENILSAIKELKTVKPVIVSMGDVAASGGYYISSNADYIFAEKYSITGSIGVVAMIPEAQKLADKVGITTDKIHKGKYVGLFDIFSKKEPKTLDMIRKNIQDTYWEFKTRVSEGRKIPVTKVETIAQGQVWNSKDALKKKLIDFIGNLDEAIAYAAKKSNLTTWTNEYYPKKKSYLELLLQNNFNFNIFYNFSQSKIEQDLKIDNSLLLYDMIKEDPIQMLFMAEIN